MNKINFLKIQTLKTTYLEKERESRREKKKGTYGEHERGIEDGSLGAKETGVLAIGELLVGSLVHRFRHQIFHSPLPVLRFSSPAIASEHAHLSLSLSSEPGFEPR